jgi:hypothetical protein
MLKRAAFVLLFLVAGLIAGYALLRLSLPVIDGELAPAASPRR